VQDNTNIEDGLERRLLRKIGRTTWNEVVAEAMPNSFGMSLQMRWLLKFVETVVVEATDAQP